jgi:hypothetical protein
VDEASGVPRVIFEAIEGNRMGGATILLLSNPTKNEGEFFDAFHSKSKLYFTLKISSRNTPNAILGYKLFPGLCQRAEIEEKIEE